MTSGPSILHADLDAFYASVEQRDDPKLRGRPLIVGHGVVLAASYEAKARGVRTAMNGAQARQACPEAIVVSPRMSAYSEASEAVFEVFEQTSPVVEALSIDEAFLDVGGLEHISGSPTEIAVQLRRDVLEQVGLPISVGLARTKFLAKVASGMSKPDGLLVVEEDDESAFLHPLPIERLWGVGQVTAKKLGAIGVTTVGQIASCNEDLLVAVLGPAVGRKLLDLANNRDPREVRPRRPRRSIGAQSAFRRSSRSLEDLDVLAASLVDRITRRLRSAGRVCRTTVIRLRFDDFTRASRSHTLPHATNQTETILGAVRELLADAMPTIESKGITLLGVSLENLENGSEVQMELPLDGRKDSTSLDATLDDLRDRFGSDSITRASLLTRGEGTSVPLLPD
ncbi:MAG TPA: DNA polymerase IV [Solirubrobacterales bacterium]|nr:DNA polymerase IV [Solirubrobacterales bacterium]